MREFNKIFGIGISRTGTSSLTVALAHLGIAVIHWPAAMADFSRFRGATDITVACRFRELDQIFPDSLFIYTERDVESWLPSVSAHYATFANSPTPPDPAQAFRLEAEIRIYGKLKPTASDFPTAYRRHQKQVLEYFHSRTDRLLRMNLGHDDGWPQLCNFLCVPVPEITFPHLNKRRAITTPG